MRINKDKLENIRATLSLNFKGNLVFLLINVILALIIPVIFTGKNIELITYLVYISSTLLVIELILLQLIKAKLKKM